MSDTPIKVLLSNGVRNFLSGGGQIGLKGQEDATGRLYWIVVARSLDGATFHVLETRHGTPRRLITPSAAYHYLARYFPDADHVCIPTKRDSTCFAGL